MAWQQFGIEAWPTVVLIDGAKGVEPQTLRLMEVCRMRDTGEVIDLMGGKRL